MSRMLPSGKMSRFHALSFGFITGALGCSVLFSQVNPTAGFLAFGNIILYALIYTPLKQKHPINTWVGAIVGAIPPLIGWTAATGGEIDAGGYVLGSLLFLWQIPHFMSLSYMLKDDYRVHNPLLLLSLSLSLSLSLFCTYSNLLIRTAESELQNAIGHKGIGRGKDSFAVDPSFVGNWSRKCSYRNDIVVVCLGFAAGGLLSSLAGEQLLQNDRHAQCQKVFPGQHSISPRPHAPHDDTQDE